MVKYLCIRTGETEDGRKIFFKITQKSPPLDKKYGYFQCFCHRSSAWESSHVYCIPSTKKVRYKQRCRECKRSRNPYHLESLICKECQEVDCVCQFEDVNGKRRRCRNIDFQKKHRAELCQKCEAGHPCVHYTRR